MGKKIRVKRLQGSPYAIENQVEGRGASATIVKAYNLQNLKEELVSKIISIEQEEHSGVYKAELQILKTLPNHPNLVNYKKIQISSQKNLYLIMQYCNGGNLDKFMYDCKYNILQQKIWFFLKQFCDGYKILYDKLIIHRDIKPQNILIHNGNFKIADFGLSTTLKDHQVMQNLSVKGTPIYMAPELPYDKEGNSKIDVFSLGIVLFKMAFQGKYPFFDQGRRYKTTSEYFKELKVRKLVIPQNNKRSPQLVDLIIKMLKKVPEERISWKQIFQHPKIIKAFRPQRKKQLIPMQQYKKSLIFVNKSIIKLQQVSSQIEPSTIHGQQSSLILQQIFNKTGKSILQRKLYRFKLTYTLIQYANNKIKTFLKQYHSLHIHLKKIFHKLMLQGLEFSLYIIDLLRDISGSWSQFKNFQIQNFQNIFDSDRLVIEEELKKLSVQIKKLGLKMRVTMKQQNDKIIQFTNTSNKSIKLSYEDLLYDFLTQFWDYPTELKKQLTSIVTLLVDTYDLSLKLNFNDIQIECQWQLNKIQQLQNLQSNAFYTYLLKTQKMTIEQLKKQMQTKGLIFK